MKKPFLNRVADGWNAFQGRKTGQRTYNAAQVTNATSDWAISLTSADTELRNDVVKLRARSRDLERNSPYWVRYLAALENNVLGSEGIGLTMKIKDPSGDYDTEANKIIGDAWAKWCQPENCSASRTLSWRDQCGLALRSAARDGGILFNRFTGFINPFGYRLQLLEIDYLDVYYNAVLDNGNEVRMGVELDKWKVPVAYWIWTRHPGDYYSLAGFKRERVSADLMGHLFRSQRAGQTVGAPWCAPIMGQLNQLEKYDEAELIAARNGAAQNGFFTTENSEEFQGDEVDANGNQIIHNEPGVNRALPKGWGFVANHPVHPTTAYGEYVKAVIRQISAGLVVSYSTLSGDLSEANYGSQRVGMLEEREEWKGVQNWFIDDFCCPTFLEWLECALLSGEVKLPFSKLDKFAAHEWKPRRWGWIDPLKDMEANILAINNRLASPQSLLAENGKDPELVLDEIKEWGKMQEDRDLPPIVEAAPTPKSANNPPSGEADPPAAPAKKKPA